MGYSVRHMYSQPLLPPLVYLLVIPVFHATQPNVTVWLEIFAWTKFSPLSPLALVGQSILSGINDYIAIFTTFVKKHSIYLMQG